MNPVGLRFKSVHGHESREISRAESAFDGLPASRLPTNIETIIEWKIKMLKGNLV